MKRSPAAAILSILAILAISALLAGFAAASESSSPRDVADVFRQDVPGASLTEGGAIKAARVSGEQTARRFARERLCFIALLVGLLCAVLALGIAYVRLKNCFEELNATRTAFYKALPDLLFCKNINNIYISCNTGFAEFLGLKESDIVGKRAEEIYPPDKQAIESIQKTDERVIREQVALTTHEWLPYPDGTRRLMEITKVPLVRNGTVTGLLGTAKDVTKYNIEEEKAREASRVKSAFLAHVSHEIRTPLNAIMGMAELLLREALSKTAHENALIIHQSSAHLLSIINDLLDFAKIEAGKLTIIPEEYSFSSLIHDIINIIRMRVVRKSVMFVVNVDCNIPDTLVGDAIRIRQVLLNVLSNAAKYTDEGFISLTITCDMQADAAVLTAEVSDSGVGIKEELVGKLFDDFFQVNPGKNKRVEGTGLGLAITRALCSAMGGEVTVKSEYGVGSTFTVVFPQQYVKGGETIARVANPEQKRILVYEPRSVHADSIARSLDNLGVSGTVVATRSDFVNELAKQDYPFVFAPYFLHEFVESALKGHDPKPALVLMTEFGEFVSTKNVRTIVTPLYSLPIANILNDADCGKEYHRIGDQERAVIAPSAKILVVDDLKTNLKVVEGLLSPYKMQIDTCNTGMDAVNMAKKYRYDLIFMDHMMPGMDGLETTGKIRALEEGSGYYSAVPIIALTANVVSGMKEIFLKSGLNDLLAKPIEPSKLYSLLEKWVPSGKFHNVAIEAEESAAATELIEIEGIDIATGISLNGGKREKYLETLGVFHKESLGKIDEIRNCLKNNDIKQYTTHVHALKSAFLTVGAIKLSDFARTLETAGRNETTAFLMENNGIFLTELENLLLHINHALLEIHSKQEKDDDSDADESEAFKVGLCKLKASLQRMDAGEINANITALACNIRGKKYRETIKKISQLILEFEYDDAVGLINGLL